MSIEAKKIRSVKAHSTGVSLIEISPKGDLVATAADKVFYSNGVFSMLF